MIMTRAPDQWSRVRSSTETSRQLLRDTSYVHVHMHFVWVFERTPGAAARWVVSMHIWGMVRSGFGAFQLGCVG